MSELRDSHGLKRRAKGFIHRSLWVLELGALAGSYLAYYFIGVQMEIVSLPQVLVFVPH